MTKLKAVRLSKGLTQTAVAKALGVSARMYQYLEASERQPSWKVANKLEDLFQIPAHELLEKEAV
ncbi:helix-turn-helix transcriptional regulator [Shimazuella kribbensis]|uniref:helix-turn-helix transcriptional regulator n=1 Tax=Shimazuella kribbensis TaxID=139808 RepID=UPI0003FF41F4|nr:helix-turn-helix transcriptional regulator [Shimazuella kribbensis]